jgi:formylglycine-generating enzyme required for sulfatase activity/dienelactone hydrolase
MLKRSTTSRRLTATSFLAVLYLAALLLPLLPAQAQKPLPPATRESSDQREPVDPAKSAERLKDENQQLREQLNELRSQLNSIVSYLTFLPESATEDYAQARSQFRTKLLRKGPPPQPAGPLPKPPAGVTEIEYTSGELRLKAWLNRPADEQRKRPAVVFLHGGFAFGTGDWEQAQPYRDAGFIVLTPTLRGENGQAGAWSSFYDEVGDVLAATEYLSKQPYVDAGNIFLAGHSVGGTLTLLSAMASSRFRAAASFDGNPLSADRPDFVPFDTRDPREIQLRSPLVYTTSFKCPVRIYSATARFGTGRHILPLAWLRSAFLAKRQGLDVEAVEIEGDHTTHVPAAMRQSILFFKKIYAQEIDTWNGTLTPLPKTIELDLGNNLKLKVARLELGKYLMGSPADEAGRGEDETQHEVAITKAFGIGVYEVTQAQYRQVMGLNPSTFSPKRGGPGTDRVVGLNTDNFPVEFVRWEDAMDFCRAVSLMPGVVDKGWVVDLPTEAEWEYAARAGTQTAFPYGSALSSQQANFNGNSPYGGAAIGTFLGRPATVGSYAPNAWGLYDVLGNVQEWCRDWYSKDYQSRTQTDNRARVIRGGGWGVEASKCRAAQRGSWDPLRGAIHTGFRVVVRLREK